MENENIRWLLASSIVFAFTAQDGETCIYFLSTVCHIWQGCNIHSPEIGLHCFSWRQHEFYWMPIFLTFLQSLPETATLEISVAVPQEDKNGSSLGSIYATLGDVPKNCFILPQGHFLCHVHCYSIHDGQRLQMVLMFLNRRNGYSKCDIFTKWSVTQSLKKKKMTPWNLQANRWN